MSVVLSWSSGKDAAWALHVLQRQGAAVTSLLTTLDATTGQVGTHGVPLAVVEAQARASARS